MITIMGLHVMVTLCISLTINLDYLPQIRQSLLRIEIVNNCSNGVNVESCSVKELVGYLASDCGARS